MNPSRRSEQKSFPRSLDIVPVSFQMNRDGFGKERSVSRAYRNCQTHVQRLRVYGEAPSTSGSRGCVPGELCHLLSSCCSNPRRYGLCPVVRLCECMPWAGAGVKSTGETARPEIPAKIAAFRKGGPVSHKPAINRHPGESRGPFHRVKGIPAFAGRTVGDGGGRNVFHPSQALSRIHYIFHTTACWLEARTGASSPSFFPHAMPP